MGQVRGRLDVIMTLLQSAPQGGIPQTPSYNRIEANDWRQIAGSRSGHHTQIARLLEAVLVEQLVEQGVGGVSLERAPLLDRPGV